MRRSGTFRSRRWGRKKLIVLERQGGREDVENAYYRNPADYSVLFFPRLVVKASAHFFLGDRLSDQNYLSATAGLQEAVEAYRDHLAGVLKWFKRIFGLSAILQFNVIYYAEQELARACKSVNVSFVCLQKEAAFSPLQRDSQGQYFRGLIGTFRGDAIAFYSHTSREIFESEGLISSGRSFVVGCARLDESHRLRGERRIPVKGCVLFYLIENRVGLTQIPALAGLDMNWSVMAQRVNAAILEFAADNPDVQFVLKAKSGHAEEQLNLLLSHSPSEGLPANVRVQSGGTGHKLLRSASVVVGFNSTAVLEAIAAGIPTVVPHLLSKKEKEYAGGVQLVREGVQVVETVQSLKKHLVDGLNTQTTAPVLGNGEKIVLERFLGNSDGRSGQRLRDFLDRAVAGALVQG